MDNASLSPLPRTPELSEDKRAMLLHLLQTAITAKPKESTLKHKFPKMFGGEKKKDNTSMDSDKTNVSLPLDIPHLPFDARCDHFESDDHDAIILENTAETIEVEEEIGAVGDLAEEERMIQREHWNWNELSFSSNYNMFLLRWETDLQVELGKSILGLLRSLRDAIAQVISASLRVLSMVLESNCNYYICCTRHSGSITRRIGMFFITCLLD